MNKYLNRTLLAGTAAAALCIGAVGGVQAQSQMPGFFGSLAGWYAMGAGDSVDLVRCCFTPTSGQGGARVTPDDGFGGKAYAGYRFMGAWDVALGVQGTGLDRGKHSLSYFGNPSRETMKANYWAGDIEAGYNFAQPGMGLRVFVGARYAEFDHDYRLATLTGSQIGFYKSDAWGVGPRVGFDGAFGIENTNLSLFANASVSALFGKRRIHDSDGSTVWRGKNSETMINAEGALGFAYEIAPNVNIGVGYRVDFWNNALDTRATGTDCCSPVEPLVGSGSGERLVHGPFVRLAYNIGVPRPVAKLAVTPTGLAKNYVVFFDFDRSVLTPAARDTIKQASDASKAGGVQRVNVTGHADKSGADQYNMALSLRRANAVKDELVRNGVPAAAIVVVGRGESQPLVPTGDGVREPQNRRVEIVLN